jgi:NhaP-type Na+/H+ or K+/H+ antiporter
MTIPDPWLLILCIATLLLVLGATSGLVNTHLWVSEPVVCVAVGAILGPACFGLINLDLGSDLNAAVFLREVARATLAVSVTAAAMRLPRGWLRRSWLGTAIALGPGMLAMWAVSSAAAMILGLPWAICLLLGAVVTPTDPVLSAPIITGRLAREAVPDDLRHGLTAESAANDGLAALLISFSLLLAAQPPETSVAHWLTFDVLWTTTAAVCGGGAAGWLAGHALNWAERRRDADPAPLLTIALALAALSLAGMQVVGGNGILAAFVAGVVLNEAIDGEQEVRQERFNEGLSRFFDLPVLVLFGVAMPWADWRLLGWHGVAFAAAVLLLRRLPTWLVLGSSMPWTRRKPEALFAGWFGPVGAAALFYACDIQVKNEVPGIWPATSLVVFCSVLLHGITGTPLTHLLGRTLRQV